MMRQNAIDKRERRVDEIQHTAVFFDHRFDKQAGLFAHIVEQFIVDRGEARRVGLGASEIAKLQPLRREVVDQVRGFGIGHHAPHLLLQHVGFAQLSLIGEARAVLRPACWPTGSKTVATRTHDC